MLKLQLKQLLRRPRAFPSHTHTPYRWCKRRCLQLWHGDRPESWSTMPRGREGGFSCLGSPEDLWSEPAANDGGSVSRPLRATLSFHRATSSPCVSHTGSAVGLQLLLSPPLPPDVSGCSPQWHHGSDPTRSDQSRSCNDSRAFTKPLPQHTSQRQRCVWHTCHILWPGRTNPCGRCPNLSAPVSRWSVRRRGFPQPRQRTSSSSAEAAT